MQYCDIYLQGVNKIRKALNKNSVLPRLYMRTSQIRRKNYTRYISIIMTGYKHAPSHTYLTHTFISDFLLYLQYCSRDNSDIDIIGTGQDVLSSITGTSETNSAPLHSLNCIPCNVYRAPLPANKAKIVKFSRLISN